MLGVLRRNPVALLLAVVLHLGLAVLLVVGVDWREKVKPIGADVMVVQAQLVDQEKLDAEVSNRRAAEREKAEEAAAAKRAEQEKKAALEKRRAEEKRKLAELEQQKTKRKQEQARKAAEAKKKAEAEKVRLAELKRKEAEEKQSQEAEKRRQVELEKKQKLEQQKRKEEEVAREKAAAEAKAKKEAEARKRAEAEKKRKAEAKSRADREAREAELAAQFAAEQDASEKARVVGLMRDKVERNWLRPPGTGEMGLRCTVRVRLGGTGSVLLVDVVKSSGNSAFDRSVEAAVRKADPLPMPRSKRLAAQFRDIEFVFEPGN